MMHILFTILKILGILILILLCLVIIIICLVLFVPIRYSAQGRYDDPEGHENLLPDRFKERASGQARVTWLGKAVCLTVQYPEGELISARVFGFKLPVEKFLHKEKKEEKPQEEKKEEEKKPSESIWEKLEKIPDRIDDLIWKKDYYMKVLTGSCGRDTLNRVKKEVLQILVSVLPAQWVFGGTIGLGDIERGANLMEAAGYTYPVTAGHLFISPNWEQYQFDLTAAFDGKITLCVIVFAGIRLILSKNVRRFIRKIRKGPGPRGAAAGGNADAGKAA